MIGSTLLLSASQSTRQLWDLGCHIGMSSTGSHVRGRVGLLIAYNECRTTGRDKRGCGVDTSQRASTVVTSISSTDAFVMSKAIYSVG